MIHLIVRRGLVQPIVAFFRRDTASSLVMLAGCVAAVGAANSPWGGARYFPAIWETPLRVPVGGGLGLPHTLLHWINDGLMALFFLVVGLEIKREVLGGELATRHQAALPLVCALGGMLVPAGIYALCNAGTPTAGGWGIPMATDIVFAVAVLQLLGTRVPLALRVFLTALAIIDDLGAIVVIAAFYTPALHIGWLTLAGAGWLALLALGRLGVRHLAVYLAGGLGLWYLMLESGVHATLAGVLLAIAVPMGPHAAGPSPALRLEHRLLPVVAFGIVPLFAFANTSIVIAPHVLGQLTSPVALGIGLGLLLGKPLGIGAAALVAVRWGGAALPTHTTWRQLWGAAILCGIGFTMSIFLTLLAFPDQPDLQAVAKTATLLASVLAGIVGYGWLRAAPGTEPRG